MSPNELLVNMGTGSLEEFYPSVAIASLMRVIRDPTLSQYHNEVVQAVTYIFRALGIKSVPFIPQVSIIIVSQKMVVLARLCYIIYLPILFRLFRAL